MCHPLILRLLVCASILNLEACDEVATLPEQAGVGPNPMLPLPSLTLIPTVNIAPAEGLSVRAFASGLDHRTIF
jgi:hypothetical protein